MEMMLVGNISGNVAGLRLDNRERGHAAAARGGRAEPRRALEQAGMQIEHVAGIRLAARGTLEQQADGAVGDGVLG